MTEDTIDFALPAENPEEEARECHMSIELFQNARQTMGELHDIMRASGLSWDDLQKQIERTKPQSSPLARVLDRLDDYTTGLGHSLYDKPSNLQ